MMSTRNTARSSPGGASSSRRSGSFARQSLSSSFLRSRNVCAVNSAALLSERRQSVSKLAARTRRGGDRFDRCAVERRGWRRLAAVERIANLAESRLRRELYLELVVDRVEFRREANCERAVGELDAQLAVALQLSRHARDEARPVVLLRGGPRHFSKCGDSREDCMLSAFYGANVFGPQIRLHADDVPRLIGSEVHPESRLKP